MLPTSGELGGCAQQEGGLRPPPQQAVQPPHAWTRLLPTCHAAFSQKTIWTGKFQAEMVDDIVEWHKSRYPKVLQYFFDPSADFLVF